MPLIQKTDQLLSGFRIERFLTLHDWRLFSVTPGIPFSIQETCPAGCGGLRTLATLAGGNAGKQLVRIGCCDACGYTGYINRPAPEWINSFYRDTWDFAQTRDINEMVETIRGRNLSKDKKRKNKIKVLLEKFPISRERSVCEIGCGYAGTLAAMRKLGFRRLIGTEHSPHRAEIGSRAYDIRIPVGPFESEAVRRELEKQAPFGLIFSHHVLEHVYNPEEVIQSAASLQDTGDYLLLSLPNFNAEPSLGVLLYVPHLHSFTPESLRLLLGKFNYAVADDSFSTDAELFVLARKVSSVSGSSHYSHPRYNDAVEKLYRGLGLGKSYQSNRRLLWAYRARDIGGQAPHFYQGMLTSLEMAGIEHFSKYRYNSRGVLADDYRDSRFGIFRLINKRYKVLFAEVRGLERRMTDFIDSPIEIQWPDEIMLSYK